MLRDVDLRTLPAVDALAARAGAPTDTLARVGAAPWIVAGPGYVIVASALDPAAADLPVRAAFVPWLAEVVGQRLAGEGGTVVPAAPGATIVRPEWADALEAPGGDRLPLSGRTVTAPQRPGVYFLLRGVARAGALVVAPEAEESALARMPAAQLGARLDSRDVTVDGELARWSARLFDSGARRPLLGPVLLAALALLVAETAMARGRARRPEAAAA